MPEAEPKVRFVVEATISPSEDPNKVADAMRSVVMTQLGSISVWEKSARLVSEEGRLLLPLKEQLRDRRIRSVARRQLLLNKAGQKTSLMLNRQAAAAGVIAVCGGPQESPLGPIYLTLSSRELDKAIDWLTGYVEG